MNAFAALSLITATLCPLLSILTACPLGRHVSLQKSSAHFYLLVFHAGGFDVYLVDCIHVQCVLHFAIEEPRA